MGSFTNTEGAVIVAGLVTTIQQNRQYLSDIDGAIGDGDHGVNMSKGFTKASEELEQNPGDLSHSLKTLGTVLMASIGGSMGPLYGTLFRRMARTCRGVDIVDAQVFGAMLSSALDGLRSISEAQVGDKTLMDTLVPSVEAYVGAVANGHSFADALFAMQEAAVKGRASTRDMVAKVGRSSRIGERSRGVEDPGAVSCCLLLRSMAGSIAGLLRQPVAVS